MRFRTEKFSGSNVRDVVEVMRYEIFELDNIDILLTLRNTLLKDSIMLEQINYFIEEKKLIGFLNISSKIKQLEFCKNLLDEINIITNKKIKYALWLANLETVKSFYNYDDIDDNIDAYDISDIILSDLGQDGTLYGYEELPKKIETKTLT